MPVKLESRFSGACNGRVRFMDNDVPLISVVLATMGLAHLWLWRWTVLRLRSGEYVRWFRPILMLVPLAAISQLVLAVAANFQTHSSGTFLVAYLTIVLSCAALCVASVHEFMCLLRFPPANSKFWR